MIIRENVPNGIRQAVFERDSYTCQYCECSGNEVDLEIEHIIPISKGGNNDIRNLATACRTCNRTKGARILTTGELQQIADKINSSLEYLMSLASEEPEAEIRTEKKVPVSVYLKPETYEKLRILSNSTHESIGDTLSSLADDFANANEDTVEEIEKALRIVQSIKIKRVKYD